MKKSKIRTIVYSPVSADLFHYGHLRSLKFANSLGDYHICGILTDKAIESFRRKPIANLKERKSIISNLKFIDRVIIQDDLDPSKNLKEIREEFKDAELIVVYGNDWKKIPWVGFIEKLGGKIIQHPYYDNLSEFKIINKLLESYKDGFKDFEDFSKYFRVKDFIEFDGRKIKETIISTKANTLKALQPFLKKSKIEKSFIFTVGDWYNKQQELLNQIKKEFYPLKIVIRSSAVNEDTLDSSMAGCFCSQLNVKPDNTNIIKESIERVIKSYKKRNLNNLSNQILIQTQTKDIKISGVVFTNVLETNSPYYVINYDDESGLSDTVTKGIENKTMMISRFCNPKDYPKEVSNLISSIKEIENIIPDMGLDIEFAINKNGEVIIFQVRPIAVKSRFKDEGDEEKIKKRIVELKKQFKKLSKRRKHLSGNWNCFGDMPDWNPAEIIGNCPNYLDYSLYDYILMNSAWHEARSSQGYYNVNPAKLVILFGNKPYIDVRNTFNSFTPNSITKKLREKLLEFYLNKLKNNPELQDKVEFEILYTCYDFSFSKRSKELIKKGFSQNEVNELKKALKNLTNNLIKNSKKLIEEDLNATYCMANLRKEAKEIIKSSNPSPKILIKQVRKLLDDCRNNGTVQFSRLARLAFIGKIMLKSLVKKKIISEQFYHSFLNSISTVATKMNSDFILLRQGKLSKHDFLKMYGHLRPGTYDITSPRYDKNPNLLKNVTQLSKVHKQKSNFKINGVIYKKISHILTKHEIECDAKSFLDFIRSALETREFAKFEFTKSLSDAIEYVAEAGELLGFSREDLSYLDVNSILKCETKNENQIKKYWKTLIDQQKKKREFNKKIILPPIIFSKKDFDVITYYSARPNFITQKIIEASTINLNEINKDNIPELEGKIVILESGDPGYDWIFTKNPAGLITKYGGVASHMAIRCAEFGLPAAIGCGDVLFNMIKKASFVTLNCKLGRIIPSSG